jgi:hypothetical protein
MVKNEASMELFKWTGSCGKIQYTVKARQTLGMSRKHLNRGLKEYE